MPTPKPWLKMWGEWLHDPKMLSLSLAEQGAWWRLVTLAQECDADGSLVKGNGAPLTVPEIANCLHISTPRDMKTLQSMIEKMEAAGSLDWNSETLTVVHFAERQARIPSETKEAIRERVRQYRERQRVTEKPLQQPDSSPPLSDKDIEGDKEAEAEEECNGVTSVTRNRKTVTTEAILTKIVKCHEENFGIITPILAEKFKEFVENYHGPIEWIKKAFAEAVTHNARKWAYVEAILERWQIEGFKAPKIEEGGRGEQPRKRPQQERKQPLKYIRGSGEPGPEDTEDMP